MRKTKKALASLAIAGMVLSMAPMSVFAATTTNRISDADRVGTAIAIAANGWTASDSVIVVPADDANIVDALAAAPLAGQLNAPILVTYKGALDPKVQQEIVNLKAKNVYAVGALSDDVVNSLKAISGVAVTPLKGADRTETAAMVAAKLTNVKGSFVVAYNGTADAMSAASFAAANGYDILVANPDGTLPANEAAYKGATVYTVGGQVTLAGATALSGADRYATNDAVVSKLAYKYDKVYVANGETLVDALAGSSLAAKTQSPIVLADATHAAKAVNANLTTSSQVIALGGTGAVSDSVLGQVAYQAPSTLAVQSVSAINADQIKVVFNRAVDKDSLDASGNVQVSSNSFVGTVSDGLSSDGTTLVLTLGAAVANNTYVTLTLSNIKDAAGSNMTLTYSTSVSFYDATAPSITSITSTTSGVAASTVKVYFSEPLGATPTFQVDGKSVASATPNATKTKYTLTVNTGNELSPSASHTVTVINATDTNSNTANIMTQSFNVTTDTVAPSVTLSSKSDDTLVLNFSKQMIQDPTNSAAVDHTGNVKVMDETGTTYSAIVALDSNDTNTNLFDVTLPSTVYAAKDTHTFSVILSNNITDYVGNQLPAQTPSITLTKDSTDPVVTGLSFDTDSNSGKVKDVVFNFSKGLAAAPSGVSSSKITVIDNNGNSVTNFLNTTSSAISAGDTSVTFPMYNNTPVSLNGTYTFYILSGLVTDNSTQANTSDAKTVTLNFAAASTTFKIKQADFGPTGSYPTVTSDKTQTLTVYFEQAVKGGAVAGSATDVNNYSLNGGALPTGTYIYLTSGNTANIVIPKGAIASDNLYATLTVNNVQNVNGLVVNPYTGYVAVVDNTKPVLQTAQIITPSGAAQQILLTFDSNMNQSITGNIASQLTIKNGSTTYAGGASAAIVVGNKHQVLLTLDSATSLNLTQVITVETSNASTLTDTSTWANIASDVTVTATK